jgi:hypothetical protein
MISTLITCWKLLKELIVTSEEADSASKMNSGPIMPLPCNLLACNNAASALDPKGSKVPEDEELVDMTERVTSFVCHHEIRFYLISKLMPVANIIFRPWLGSTRSHESINVIRLVLLMPRWM